MKKVILPLLILLIAIGITVVLFKTKPEVKVVDKPAQKWLVSVQTVTLESVYPQISLYGRIESPNDATLTAAVTADVEEVTVLEGAHVTRGQLLVKLDDTDVQLVLSQRQADLKQVEAQIRSENKRHQRDLRLLKQQKQLLSLADRAVDRATKLEQSKLASQANLDTAMTDRAQRQINLTQLQHDIDEHPVRLAELDAQKMRTTALLEQAKVDLERTFVRAPFDGRVAKRLVAVGDRVRVGDSLIQVYDTSSLEVRAQIPGKHAAEIRSLLNQGDSLNATAEIDGVKQTFTLSRLSGEVNTDTGGVDGLFVLNSDINLALGSFIELKLLRAEQSEVVVLPYSALYGLDRVYAVEQGYLKAIPVERIGEIERHGEKKVILRSNQIKNDDQIIITQLPNAITGLAVKVNHDD